MKTVARALLCAILLALAFAISLTARPGPWHEIWDRSTCAPHCQP